MTALRFMILTLGVMISATATAESSEQDLPDGLAEPCEARDGALKNVEMLSQKYKGETGQCYEQIQRAKHICQEKGPEAAKPNGQTAADPNNPNGVRAVLTTNKAAFEDRRNQFSQQGDSCAEEAQKMADLCAAEEAELVEQGERARAGGASEDEMFLHSVKEGMFRKLKDTSGRAFKASINCSRNQARIYEAAAQQLATTIASIDSGGPMPPETLQLMEQGPGGQAAADAKNRALGHTKHTLLEKGAEHALDHAEHVLEHSGRAGASAAAGLAAKAVPVAGAAYYAAKGDGVGLLAGAACIAGNWACLGAGVLATGYSYYNSCNGTYYDPVAAYAANCGLTTKYGVQSINSAIGILEQK